MSARKRINKNRFHAINRDVKLGIKVSTIAIKWDVSEETVRTIRRAKTWPRFEAMKKLKNEKRRPSTPHTLLKAVVPVQQPLTPVEKLDKITQDPGNQIRPELSDGVASPIKVITVKEWEDLNRKVGRLYGLMSQSRRKTLLSIFRRTK